MKPSVLRLADIRGKKGSGRDPRSSGYQPIAQTLPLNPRDFAGRIIFWPSSCVDDPDFDRTLRLRGVQSIVDLRDDPVLGSRRALHLGRCHALERWDIAYLRLGPAMARAERKSMFAFEVMTNFITEISADRHLLETLLLGQSKGAVVVIHPDGGERVKILIDAFAELGIACPQAPPLLGKHGTNRRL